MLNILLISINEQMLKMDEDCTKCEYYLRSIVGECPNPCKRDKICMKCDAEWRGKPDDRICPECKEHSAFDIYYNVINWDRCDELFDDYYSAEEFAKKLVEDGDERVSIYTLFDNGLETLDAECIETFGEYYEGD